MMLTNVSRWATDVAIGAPKTNNSCSVLLGWFRKYDGTALTDAGVLELGSLDAKIWRLPIDFWLHGQLKVNPIIL
jgi:hypothetical protein